MRTSRGCRTLRDDGTVAWSDHHESLAVRSVRRGPVRVDEGLGYRGLVSAAEGLDQVSVDLARRLPETVRVEDPMVDEVVAVETEPGRLHIVHERPIQVSP